LIAGRQKLGGDQLDLTFWKPNASFWHCWSMLLQAHARPTVWWSEPRIRCAATARTHCQESPREHQHPSITSTCRTDCCRFPGAGGYCSGNQAGAHAIRAAVGRCQSRDHQSQQLAAQASGHVRACGDDAGRASARGRPAHPLLRYGPVALGQLPAQGGRREDRRANGEVRHQHRPLPHSGFWTSRISPRDSSVKARRGPGNSSRKPWTGWITSSRSSRRTVSTWT